MVMGKIGGTGLNMGDFDAVVHYEMPYTSIALEQRFGRIDRMEGGTNNSKIMYFILNDEEDPDDSYIANRFLYNKDDSYIFNINALAYSVEIINNDNMICVSPTYDIDSEHYDIDTIVNRVSIYDEFVNEQKVWQLDVVIGYTPDGDEIPLVVYFTKKSLNGNPIPQKGDNVHLSVSIQGSLVAINKELSKPFILSI